MGALRSPVSHIFKLGASGGHSAGQKTDNKFGLYSLKLKRQTDMETTSRINLATKSPTTGGPLIKLFQILSMYPFAFVAMLLLSGLIKSHFLASFAILTLVIYMFFGSITWLVSLICLLVKKKISFRQIILNVIILATGIIAAYFVLEYDILSSGAKYID